MQNKKNGFTVLEMMIVMLVIALLLLITLPNIQQKETIIRDKGCQALLDIVDSQIILYEINNLTTPTSVQELINEGYLKEGQDRCPNGLLEFNVLCREKITMDYPHS
ncbi:competence type IV pilus major pilin ComGC [Faecalitalea cylindroides]|uniref:competence type IV pilus major pilin ComGC n=1 Tax=Faecalitalea cylindroides TaxID=39483 RepID=UPI002E78F2BD|nr:competence type IV pilus major pilin ComGC [Faecalitalea cylindroides]MEE1449687.1 competence type IV pilus major pilin ComGC [Faecalitalea cylindroides]